MASLAITCFGSAHHYLGVAALTDDKFDIAVRHLDAAVAANEALLHGPAAEASRLRLAESGERRSVPGGLASRRVGEKDQGGE